MSYFCRAHCVSAKNKEITTYIVLPDESQNLTEEILRENQQFKEFISDNKLKNVYVDYEVYQTEEKLDASTQPEVFEQAISSSSQFYSRGELTIEQNSKVVKKKKSSTGTIILVACICALLAGGAGIGGGYYYFKKNMPVQIEQPEKEPESEDGMFIPEQEEIDADVDQITVSIDRSYSAVPTEDLELKGEVVKGKATITLPEFDKEDFFTHVQGYTWGFATDPNAKKIEYYGGQSYDFTENTKLYRVLVKYGGGSGTKEDPYLIDYYDQLELMSLEKARGYFKQTADLYFPDWAYHTPIDTVNELKKDPTAEYFEYDGGGYIINGLDKPLFGNVSGATIQNVNIRHSVMQSNDINQDYGAIVCKAYNYQYKTNTQSYTTGETLIKNCSIAHVSIIVGEAEEQNTEVESVTGTVVPPDLIEYDENGKVIEHTGEETEEETETKITKLSQGYSIGGISGNGGQIEDCYVEDFGIEVYTKEYFLNAGGISGKPANVINSGVFNFSIKGNIFYGGGIVGSAAGSRAHNATGMELPECYGGNIQGCVARKVRFNNETAAGGIAGVGGSDASNPVISNCYAKEMYFNCGEYTYINKVSTFKEGISGGIIGTEGASKSGHLITNTVSVSEKPVIGQKTKSKYDNTVRQAPDFAFYQENILTVLNTNTVSPVDPKEIYTGEFKFSNADLFGDDGGALTYPESIEPLIEKIREEK